MINWNLSIYQELERSLYQELDVDFESKRILMDDTDDTDAG